MRLNDELLLNTLYLVHPRSRLTLDSLSSFSSLLPLVTSPINSTLPPSSWVKIANQFYNMPISDSSQLYELFCTYINNNKAFITILNTIKKMPSNSAVDINCFDKNYTMEEIFELSTLLKLPLITDDTYTYGLSSMFVIFLYIIMFRSSSISKVSKLLLGDGWISKNNNNESNDSILLMHQSNEVCQDSMLEQFKNYISITFSTLISCLCIATTEQTNENKQNDKTNEISIKSLRITLLAQISLISMFYVLSDCECNQIKKCNTPSELSVILSKFLGEYTNENLANSTNEANPQENMEIKRCKVGSTVTDSSEVVSSHILNIAACKEGKEMFMSILNYIPQFGTSSGSVSQTRNSHMVINNSIESYDTWGPKKSYDNYIKSIEMQNKECSSSYKNSKKSTSFVKVIKHKSGLSAQNLEISGVFGASSMNLDESTSSDPNFNKLIIGNSNSNLNNSNSHLQTENIKGENGVVLYDSEHEVIILDGIYRCAVLISLNDFENQKLKINLINSRSSTIFLVGACSHTIDIINCSSCKVICGPVLGCINILMSSNLKVSAISGMLRVALSDDITLFINTMISSISDVPKNIRSAPYNYTYGSLLKALNYKQAAIATKVMMTDIINMEWDPPSFISPLTSNQQNIQKAKKLQPNEFTTHIVPFNLQSLQGDCTCCPVCFPQEIKNIMIKRMENVKSISQKVKEANLTEIQKKRFETECAKLLGFWFSSHGIGNDIIKVGLTEIFEIH